jgi:hypothetical protein
LGRPTPYHQYFKTTPPPQLEREGGACYRQSVFTTEEYSTIQKEVSSMVTSTQLLNEETTSSVAQNRLGASLADDSDTVRIFQNGSLLKLVQQLTNEPTMELSSHLPVEVRLYETLGAGMAWHADDVLYDPAQVEVVVTLENTSDCVTMWKIGGEQQQNMKSQETDPNSVVLLKAGGPLHCVTPLKRGRRIILKCAFAAKGAKFLEGIHTDQFGASKTRKGKKRRSKR